MMGGWFGDMLMMLLFLALIIGAVVLTLRVPGHGPTGRSSDRALEILNGRYARDEIDKAEFEERTPAPSADSFISVKQHVGQMEDRR